MPLHTTEGDPAPQGQEANLGHLWLSQRGSWHRVDGGQGCRSEPPSAQDGPMESFLPYVS